MNLIRLFHFIILTILIIGCSSSQESTKEENSLPKKMIPTETSSSHLEVKIPIGWREIKDNKDQLFDIWLVNDENNAVVAFIPIYLTEDLLQKSEEEKMALIEKIVTNKKKSNVENFEIINNNESNTYQTSKSIRFLLDDNIHNSIIYGNGEYYYECLAYFRENYSPNKTDISSLINIQKQIVEKSKIK